MIWLDSAGVEGTAGQDTRLMVVPWRVAGPLRICEIGEVPPRNCDSLRPKISAYLHT